MNDFNKRVSLIFLGESKHSSIDKINLIRSSSTKVINLFLYLPKKKVENCEIKRAKFEIIKS